MSQPILLLVDDRPEVLEALAADLSRRFGTDHRILAEGSPGAALEELLRLAEQRDEVAVVVAGQRMAELAGVPFRAHELHPSVPVSCPLQKRAAGFPLYGHLPSKLGLTVGSTGVFRLPATLGDVLCELGEVAGGVQVPVEPQPADLAADG